VLPGGSHFIQDQMPAQVNELLMGHLKRNPI